MNLPHKKNLLDFVIPFRARVVARAEKLLLTCLNRIEAMPIKLLQDSVARNTYSSDSLPSRIRKLLGYKFKAAKISSPSGIDWAPLVKVTTTPDFIGSSSVHTSDYKSSNGSQPSYYSASLDLAEKCVLCVGGHARLYPEYRHLIEALGGNLWVYRGNQKKDTERLPGLLAHADMVLCPVDCVNHEAYLAVKHYCKKSGKPCVLLQHSNFPSFRKGIETLFEASISATK